MPGQNQSHTYKRAHPRFAIEGLCDVTVEIDGKRTVLPVLKLARGGFGAQRPTDFGMDRALARAIGTSVPCQLRVAGQAIDVVSRPIYRIASHAGFQFGPLPPGPARTLGQTVRLIEIGASLTPVLRPVGTPYASWAYYYGIGPSELWIDARPDAPLRLRLSYRDGATGMFDCRFEDGQLTMLAAGKMRDPRVERPRLLRMLLVMAGAAAREPAMHEVLRVGMRLVG